MQYGTGPGLAPVSLGERGGTNQVTLSNNQLPSHYHTGHILVSDGNGDSFTADQNYLSNATPVEYQKYAQDVPAGDKKVLGVQTENVGGNLPVTIKPPYLGVSFIIAITGLFPSQQ